PRTSSTRPRRRISSGPWWDDSGRPVRRRPRPTLATEWNGNGTAGTDRQLDAVERDTAAWERIGSVLDRASGPLLGG
ncbi:hypothetical protein, partial [Streptomyces sp. NPDC002690]